MSRIKFHSITAREFIETIHQKSGMDSLELSKYCGIHFKTLSLWKAGKYLMSDRVFTKLLSLTNTPAPRISTLPDYWHTREAGRKGAMTVAERYGNPGTPEGRSRGGKRTIEKFSANPELAEQLGFITRKAIVYPKHSSALAEFIGAVLGDGGITNYQVTITVNRKDDHEYAEYLYNLIESLFKLQPSVWHRESVTNIVISRVNLVRFLKEQGLQSGNKVHNQIDVPKWIQKNPNFWKACARGLYDTDGCFYTDHHRYKEKTYLHCAMNFTNRSLPLLRFYKRSLESIGLRPTINTKFSMSLRKEREIVGYMGMIGTSNPKHKQKYELFFRHKYGEVPKWS